MRNARAALAETADDRPDLAESRGTSAVRQRATSERVPERLGFVDLTRAFAVLMMMQGHTLDALLLPAYHTGAAFHGWTFLRGLTSCFFLFLSGFVFAVATHRRWHHFKDSWPAHLRRAGRFALFLALGYLLQFPARDIANLQFATDESWRGFFAVNILQCIGVTLFAMQLLVLLTRTPTRFAVAAGVACLAVVATTPAIHSTTQVDQLPRWLAGYLVPGTGSLFSLWPWSAYTLLGASLGGLYARPTFGHSTSVSDRVLLPLGLLMIASAMVCSALPFEPFGATEFWSTSPNLFLLRSGLVLAAVSAMTHANRYVTRGRTLIRSLARESLLVYVVHVPLVYGSAWNGGLVQSVGRTTLLPALAMVGAVWIAMALLAVAWHQCKLRSSTLAFWVRIGAAGLITVKLL